MENKYLVMILLAVGIFGFILAISNTNWNSQYLAWLNSMKW